MPDLLVAVVGACVGAGLSAMVAYPLGRRQGRHQTLYEERVRIITELGSGPLPSLGLRWVISGKLYGLVSQRRDAGLLKLAQELSG
jgi:hypothetical protein